VHSLDISPSVIPSGNYRHGQPKRATEREYNQPLMDKIIEWLRGEKHVILGAPLSFGLFVVIGGWVGYWIATQHYSGQLAVHKDKSTLRLLS
jgi:hypothetical protein